MIIKDIQTEIRYIKLKTPFITSLRKVEEVEFVRVSISCNDGSVGFGEAPSTYAITKEDIHTISSTIKSLTPKLLSLTPKEALDTLHKLDIGSSAKACVDMALLALDDFFHIEDNRPIKTDITISLNNEEKMLQDAQDAFDNGMDILKIKLGSDIRHAISVTKELSTTLPSAKLLIDANQAWSLKDSLYYIDSTKKCKLELIEQPVLAKNLEELKTISQYSDIPILADEAVFNLDDVKKVYKNRYADMINIKLMKCGGITPAIKILEFAREHDIKCMLGSMLEGGVSINAALYLAFNYRDVIKFVDLDSPLLYKGTISGLDFVYKGCEISTL